MSTTLVKASLFNLLVYTHDKHRIAHFQDLIHLIIQKFPCKIIFIIGDEESKKDEFTTHISQKTVGSIVCDFIEIKTSGTHLPQVPFYILPHLEPDLPIYLLWGQDPSEENDILPEIIGYADRLIFDSECSRRLQLFSGKFLRKINEFRCHVLDMNWARFAGWRGVIAGIFETNEKFHHLQAAKEITITYNDRPTESFRNNQTQADYLQAWLATRMKWKFLRVEHFEDNTLVHYTAGDKEIQLFLKPKVVETFTAGSIVSFDLKAEDGHAVRLERAPQLPSQVRVHCESEESCDIPFTIPITTQTRGSSFIKELLYSPPSAHYIEMLQILAKENL